MRSIVSVLLAFVLILSCTAPALAVDDSRSYLFELTVDGSDTKNVSTGDIITVTFYLIRVDSAESCDMYAMQNEISYDSDFFELVEGSALLSSGIGSAQIVRNDKHHEFYMNYLSMSGGESWDAKRLIGSFQLRVIGESGASQITCQDYHVSTSDGKDHYAAAAQDVTVVISTACTVHFASNGGTEISDQTVQYGDLLKRPEDPIREGYHLSGWYRDIDLQQPWDFEKDAVRGNMTLYAKWAEGTAPVQPEEAGGSGWLLLAGIGVLAAILLLLLIMGKKTVKFETGCIAKVKAQRVKKGGLVAYPQEPQRIGRTFGGWYRDQAGTEPWCFDTDRVEKNMTLYAKWLR